MEWVCLFDALHIPGVLIAHRIKVNIRAKQRQVSQVLEVHVAGAEADLGGHVGGTRIVNGALQ